MGFQETLSFLNELGDLGNSFNLSDVYLKELYLLTLKPQRGGSTWGIQRDFPLYTPGIRVKVDCPNHTYKMGTGVSRFSNYFKATTRACLTGDAAALPPGARSTYFTRGNSYLGLQNILFKVLTQPSKPSLVKRHCQALTRQTATPRKLQLLPL